MREVEINFISGLLGILNDTQLKNIKRLLLCRHEA